MVECVDDQSIANSARLWRRVPPDQLKSEGSSLRPSSGLFSTDEMSVHLADLTSVEEVARLYPSHSIVEVTVALVRSLNLSFVRDPILDADRKDPSHAIVCPRATKGGARRLAAECTFVRLVPAPGSSPAKA
jgi:hypothetical protein